MTITGKNYYELLGVSRHATPDDIKEAFREIARVYHPDSKFYSEIIDEPISERDAEIFKAVTAAYNVLSNPEKRAEYDQTLPPMLEHVSISETLIRLQGANVGSRYTMLNDTGSFSKGDVPEVRSVAEMISDMQNEGSRPPIRMMLMGAICGVGGALFVFLLYKLITE